MNGFSRNYLHFPALRSGQRPSPGKQFPSNKTALSRRRVGIPFVGFAWCLWAATGTLAPAQDPAALAKPREQYRAKCEAARTDYAAALRALQVKLKDGGRDAVAAVVAKELARMGAAPLGTLRFLTTDPPKDIGTSQDLTIHSLGGHFGGQRRRGTGPMVGAITLPMGRLGVAADYSSEKAPTPDLIRFDFSGGEDFTDENTITIDAGEQPHYAHFGPKILQVARAGKTSPVRVSGVFRYHDMSSMLELQVGPVAEAACAFGDKTHQVRLADALGHLEFVRRTPPGNKSRRKVVGSQVMIDTGDDGTFSLKVELGQPVRVNGRWYDFVVEGQTLSAWPLDLESAKITFSNGSACSLVGKGYTFEHSDARPVEYVPAGEYVIPKYRLSSAKGADRERGWLTARGPMDGKGKPKPLFFPPNQETDVMIGEPLTARVRAKRDVGGFRLSLEVTDRAGGNIYQMQLPRKAAKGIPMMFNSRPDPSKVTVENAAGETVHEALLRYESDPSGETGHPESLAASILWQPPAGIKGRLTIKVAFDAAPFETKTETTELLIE